jgi:hypothetical protein
MLILRMSRSVIHPFAVLSVMSGVQVDCVPDSEPEEDSPSNVDIPRSSTHGEDELEEDYCSQRENDALERWYHVKLLLSSNFRRTLRRCQ